MPCRRAPRGGTAGSAAVMITLRYLAILMLALVLPAPAHARESLEQLVATAAPGATLSVPAGVHVVHLKLDKPVTLTGEPGAILDGGGYGDIVRISVANRSIDLDVPATELAGRNGVGYVTEATGYLKAFRETAHPLSTGGVLLPLDRD